MRPCDRETVRREGRFSLLSLLESSRVSLNSRHGQPMNNGKPTRRLRHGTHRHTLLGLLRRRLRLDHTPAVESRRLRLRLTLRTARPARLRRIRLRRVALDDRSTIRAACRIARPRRLVLRRRQQRRCLGRRRRRLRQVYPRQEPVGAHARHHRCCHEEELLPSWCESVV